MLNWNLTPPMRALVDALERLGGSAHHARLVEEAARSGENSAYGPNAHFGKAVYELRDRGITRGEMMGDSRMWYFTEAAARERGYTAPASPEGLF